MSAILDQYRRVLEAGRRSQRFRLVAPLEGRAAKKIAALFRRQGRAFLAELAAMRPTFVESHHGRLREAPQPEDFDRAWRRSAQGIRADFADTLDAIARAGLQTGFDAVAGTLGIDIAFNLQHPRAVAFMQTHGAALVTKIDETTRVALRSMLSAAIEKGESYDKTARAIRDLFDGFSRDRAQMVAVTENAFAYEEGSRLAAQEILVGMPPGIGMVKEWITVGDEAVDDECASAEEDGAIGIDETFSNGWDQPPAHPNCRCTASYLTAAEE